MTGGGINPTCRHAANPTGLKVKIQISFRERPILPVKRISQLAQPHFDILDFDPVEIPCLALEEVIAEKIRATCERSKIRDLYDLAEIGKREFDRDAVRLLAIWKLWRSGRVAMSFDLFAAQVSDTADYDVNDLKQLLRKDQTPSLDALTRDTISHFRFLERMTPEETAVVAKGREASPTVTKRLIETLQDWKELDPGFNVMTIGESWR